MRGVNYAYRTVVRFAGGERVIHVRFSGQSFDIPLESLEIIATSTDAEIRCAVAEHLNISVAGLDGFVIDRHETGNLTVRPEAESG